MATKFKISNGPSKWDLMISLFEGKPIPRHTVKFHLDTTNAPKKSFIIEVAINLIGQEDGSGELWIFEGWSEDYPDQKIKGYFSTHSRKGYLTIGD